MTGKTIRISVEERKEKIRQAQEEKDAYMEKNLGGFTQIYPLDRNVPGNS